ncbi:hypothetical protein N475_22920 [Pseudoalteromonas luteoviolacea DSM 6061]|uniref:Uncharacterized protein n=1 Tax=Pseudoalteromonas luteoviolacea DSM 6061 TaxID=1365250 RepID=A0A166V0P9_9GAMM|nr:hypothetical protein N475_22920 [Pseudoalteromonas luteoviolacea DSM 6061]MBE0389762.1 hypothetical protein [Pseudoalteromonas luteoviolacea DSM 6061]
MSVFLFMDFMSYKLFNFFVCFVLCYCSGVFFNVNVGSVFNK